MVNEVANLKFTMEVYYDNVLIKTENRYISVENLQRGRVPCHI